jgi:acylglycerol lipase
MQAAEAAGRINALLSLLALRRVLAVLQPLALLLLLPFRWRAQQAASSAATDAPSSAASGKKAGGKAAVVLRVPAGSPMACARRQALARREAAVRRAREAGREYELIPTARGETLFTQCWWPHGSSSAAVKPR